MFTDIKIITSRNMMGPVNCYLLTTNAGFVLVDTGWGNRREQLDQALAHAGCTPGNLQLIFLTHGDFDHIGNARHISEAFDAKVALHRSDIGMAEEGDMFYNRTSGGAFVRWLAKRLFKLPKRDRFTPDLEIDEGFDLSAYGIEGKVVHIPGHSLGSVGILLADGRLLGGDLFENRKKPQPINIMDDQEAAKASIEKLKTLHVTTVYPGHGEPFALCDFLAARGTS